jgi:small subunit ribosomal protein S18
MLQTKQHKTSKQKPASNWCWWPHAYNPSYQGGRDPRGSLFEASQPRQIVQETPSQKYPIWRKKLTHYVTAAVCLPDRGTLAVVWKRGCSQHKQVTSNEDLPIPMENPYKEPHKKCILCGKHVDYKNVQLLSQFISLFMGCIYGRHVTGLCGKKQKEITKAIKRAQIMGFMPVIYKDPAFLKDPKVCNIKYRE